MESELRKIRKTLDSWYEATATPEQEAALRDFFARTAIDDLPPDMKADAFFFRGISSVQKETGSFPGIAKALSDTAQRRKHHFLKVASHYAAGFLAAAAIASVFGIGLFNVNKVKNREPAVYGYFADGTPITDPEETRDELECLTLLNQLETPIEIVNILSNN